MMVQFTSRDTVLRCGDRHVVVKADDDVALIPTATDAQATAA
ncbi:hypothetical protein [Mycobacterium leprae]|nr:hypothetical protein [Mycobacterium leprae]